MSYPGRARCCRAPPCCRDKRPFGLRLGLRVKRGALAPRLDDGPRARRARPLGRLRPPCGGCSQAARLEDLDSWIAGRARARDDCPLRRPCRMGNANASKRFPRARRRRAPAVRRRRAGTYVAVFRNLCGGLREPMWRSSGTYVAVLSTGQHVRIHKPAYAGWHGARLACRFGAPPRLQRRLSAVPAFDPDRAKRAPV